MKKTLQFSLLGSSILGIALFSFQFLGTDVEARYEPREITLNSPDGAAEYFHKMRSNQITGKVDPADVVKASNQAKQKQNLKTSALGLNWSSLGPNNIGGRSRAFLIDKNNINTYYLGAVSGGIFKSTTAGSSWTAIDEFSTNQAVTAIAQGADGAIYYGTGEGIHTQTGVGFYSAAFDGGGVFKSTDGNTFNVMPTTVPSSASGGADWSQVSIILTDETDKDEMWVGTNRGIKHTTNGGTSWTDPVNVPGSVTNVWDMDMDANGGIWATLGSRVFYSPDGSDGSFSEISKQSAGPTDIPRGQNRIRVVSAPSDPNYIYACYINGNRRLDKVYRSTDKGSTWSVIGAGSATFDPFLAFLGGFSGTTGQGNYDLAMAVDVSNKNRLILGGIDLWEWENSSGWNLISDYYNSFPLSPWRVHPDMHQVIYHPTKPNTFFVTNDGGLYVTNDNGSSYVTLNKEFNSTQFFRMAIGQNGEVMGGTQDNGTIMNDGSGNTYKNGYEVFGGDGNDCAISWLDSDILFAQASAGSPLRSFNYAQSWNSTFFPGQRYFNAPYELYETETDELSIDSVLFVAMPSLQSLGFGNGNIDSFATTLPRPNPSATFLASTFHVSAGGDTLVADASGNISGNGYGQFDASTGEYWMVFDDAPIAEILVTCEVEYQAGANLVLNSKIGDHPYNHLLSSKLNSMDTIMIQDQVRGMMVAATQGAIYMTRDILNSRAVNWYKVLSMPNQLAYSIEISDDGNTVYVGTSTGRVYVLDNFNEARDFETADVDGSDYRLDVSSVLVGNGRNVASLSSDPNNNDRVVATLGNYGNSNFVYLCTNATSGNPTFISKQGDLPEAPVYASIVDKGDGNKVVVGTEFGVFGTDNIAAPSPVWTAEMSGLSTAPVLDMKQYRTHKSSTPTMTINEGDIYLASYGRGFYVTSELRTSRPIGIEDNEAELEETKKEFLNIYPNPASAYTTLKLDNAAKGNVEIFILDMSGRTIKNLKLNDLPQGEHDIRIDLNGVSSGSYVMTVKANNSFRSSTFMVSK